MLLLAAVIFGLSGGIFAASVLKMRTEISIPASMSFNILLLYIFFISGIPYKVTVLTAANLILLAAGIGAAFRDLPRFRTNFFTPGLAAFVLWSLLFFFLNNGRLFFNWDEFSHWGTVAKALFCSGKLSAVHGDSLSFASYPPAMALWQYISLTFHGSFSESAALFASCHFMCAFMMPVLYKSRWQEYRMNLLYFVCIPSVLLIFFEFFFTVYVDGVLALVWSYALFLIFGFRKFDLKRSGALFSALALLPLIKASGGALAAAALTAAVSVMILRKKFDCRLAVLWISGILLTIFSWKYQLHINDTPPAFSGNSGGGSFWQAVIYNNPGHSHQVIKLWLLKFFTGFPYTGKWYSFPLPVFLQITVLSAVIFYLRSRCQDEKLKKNLSAALWFFPLNTFAFAFGLLLCYIFSFSEREALILASFERYMSTVTLGFYLTVLLFLRRTKTAAGAENRKISALIFIVLLTAPLLKFCELGKDIFFIVRRDYYWQRGEMELAAGICADKLKRGEKVVLADMGGAGFNSFLMRYCIWPHGKIYPWSFGKPQYEGDVWSVEKDAASMARELNGSSALLYCHRINDYFRDRYRRLFAPDTPIVSGKLYRADKNGRYRAVENISLKLEFKNYSMLRETAAEAAETDLHCGRLRISFDRSGAFVKMRLYPTEIIRNSDFRTVKIFGKAVGADTEIRFADQKQTAASGSFALSFVSREKLNASAEFSFYASGKGVVELDMIEIR